MIPSRSDGGGLDSSGSPGGSGVASGEGAGYRTVPAEGGAGQGVLEKSVNSREPCAHALQPAASDSAGKQPAACSPQPVAYSPQPAYRQPAACSLQPAACSLQLTARSLQPTACSLMLAACLLCGLLPAAYDCLQRAASRDKQQRHTAQTTEAASNSQPEDTSHQPAGTGSRASQEQPTCSQKTTKAVSSSQR